MKLVNLIPMLEEAQNGHYAVGAFNYCNAETAQAVVEVGCELRSPVMFITGPWEVPLLGAKMMVDIAKWVAAEADVPVCLHLDHAVEIDLVKECIEAGFPSVMIDASRYDFEENVRLTKMVVDMAHPKGVTVEGELGAVGRVDDSSVEGEGETSLTDPAKAAEFVERTGVDALASAIGNAHGIYTQRPILDFERLKDIRSATGIPLVLHGGSGTPSDQLHKAIEIGISKVNVASELGRAYLDAIEQFDQAKGGKAWYAHAIMDAKTAIKQVTAKWMKVLGSTNRVP
ncbi:MAG: class II fructose-bisphosphate aldolase [Armatimonadota bacterium]|nr:class II fructose-bisphosphate aldolase [bacterium]